MAGKRRSGLANDRRGYGRSSFPKQMVPAVVVPTTYTVTYNGNNETSGTVPVDSSSPYVSGSIVTILGNVGSPILAKTGSTFAGWNTTADGNGTSYSQGNTFTINTNTTLYAQWISLSAPSAPTSLSSVGGNREAYILFTQVGTVTNYAYSTDNGVTFLEFNPPQIYSPVNITTLSSNGVTLLTNGQTYTVKLKAVNSGAFSDESVSVDVVPTVTTLSTSGRIIYLDANNASSYSGSGTAWTNLDSGGAYSATLNQAPTFNVTDPTNKYFEFNPGAATGQYAQINQASAINPVINSPFTIQMWVKINNIGAQGTLVSKVFEASSYDGYALGYKTDNTLQLHENGASKVIYFTSVAGVLSSNWVLYTANIQFGSGGSRSNKIFVNGRQVGLTQVSNNQQISNNISMESSVPSPTQNMTFPTGFYGEGECNIGQLYYYNTELTTTQIIQNFDATKHMYM